ncbi:hypothetical protein BJY16_007388 [Actinoplanes octamycinicus]|uniref:Uncharacterized protein n=1 Tax=Actinoplanes octamycinicus TaxID=135948 RepID=A0A7W7MBA1_9ACTN|nr:hypothetical protein [Actinoplanes octamycinicus]MBB4743929.1 hypothetical protein [Actinoplanes octamycinicus]GIE58555.1 hypothetical protein Aoc01nite_39570 [Actinoplanes octamycinicus]
MGYTHYWSLLVNDPGYRTCWPQLIGDTVRIIDAVRRAGITITGPYGYGRPSLHPDSEISFNGDAEPGRSADTFVLPLPEPDDDRPMWVANFCKTNRQPYDLAVTATLLRCHLLAPYALLLSSDGSWNRQWRYGRKLPGSRRRAPSPRALLTELFGPIPNTDPLTSLDPGTWRE